MGVREDVDGVGRKRQVVAVTEHERDLGQPEAELMSHSEAGCRLNRGGHRQANSALYTIVPPACAGTRTRDYVERRTAEGKTRREAIRCLKRYVAREIYQTINPTKCNAKPTS
ncbi:hypothetical protein [Streptomyces sp. NPDC001312]|uniref:hypothetical protein n=1 Tax=Streptomyces sp. NPDC001312 TaxID=3364561 RepID=UPI0036754F22